MAEEVGIPFQAVSLEMLCQGLYYFTVAHHKGRAGHPDQYFAAPENQDLGVIKRIGKPLDRLDLSPFLKPT